MMESTFDGIETRGTGHSYGGDQVADDLTDFPLLVCVDGVIMTEDGKMSMVAIPGQLPFANGQSTAEELAARYGTTPEHAQQAIDYFWGE